MIRLVLFDIDGTLIHTSGAGVKAFDRAFETLFRIPHGTREVRFAGRTDTGIFREMLARHELPQSPEHFRDFFDAYVFWLDHFLENGAGRVLPGVHDFIAGLREFDEPPAVGLLTGNIRLGAEIKLRKYALWDDFETGAFADEHEDRDRLAAIARDRAAGLLRRPLDGREILVIGDTPHDIRCARAIGASVLAVSTGGVSREQLAARDPDWLVDDLRQVRASRICGRG